MTGRRLLRTVLWQRLDAPGSEYLALWQHAQGWELSGRINVALGGRPLWVSYQVFCDPSWRTSSVDILLSAGFRVPNIRIWASEEGRWLAEFREFPQLHRCVDIDLSITPATNTLPLQRLQLAIGESREITVAWMSFPDLSLEPLRQRYTRLTESRYGYQSGAVGVELEVDDLGLVVDYPGFWKRVSSADGA